MTKNDDAWVHLFEKYNILNEIEEKGFYEISASQIKEFREPRLMVKFDYQIQLPKIFYKNNLSILPITRGKYIISRSEVYHKLEEKNKEPISLHDFPDCIESLDFNNITSETKALNCAYISGIINDFVEEDKVYPTIGGRMKSGKFDFNILDKSKANILSFSINNSQIEIDGAYEGLNSLSLIEAKIEYPENFLVRQLYYPFRTWVDCIEKQIKTILLIYSNGIFSLYEYVFEDKNCYNSLKLSKQKHYSIFDGDIEFDDILSIIDSIETIPESENSFPQADKFERVINLCELLNGRGLTRDDITEEYSFNIRQSNYYTSAGMYLGLINRSSINGRIPYYTLTKKGEEIFNLNLKQRQLELVKCILEHEIFLKLLKSWISTGIEPSKSDILETMKNCGIHNVNSQSTIERRSSTVKRWLEWILELKTVSFFKFETK